MGLRDIFTDARQRVLARRWPLLGVLASGAVVLVVLGLALLPLGARQVIDTARQQQAALEAGAGGATPADTAAVDDVFGVPDAAARRPTVEPTSVTVLLGLLVVLSVMLLWSSTVYAAAVRAYELDDGVLASYRGAFGTVLYQSSQSSVLMLPLLVPATLLVFAPAGVKLALLVALPLLALPLVLVAGLAVVATALGERAHLPRTSIAAVRANPGLAAATFGGLVLASIPAALLGLIPVIGQVVMLAVALVSVGVLVELHRRLTGAWEPQEVPVAIAPAAPVEQPVALVPVAGPLLEGVVDPATGAGEWIVVAVAGTVTLQVAWSEGPAVALQVADQAGTWLAVAQPAANGAATAFAAAAPGQYWIALAAQGPQPQSWRVATWLPAQVPAA